MIIPKFVLNERGQFFSPDLIIAIGFFVFGLVLFFSASDSIFSQAGSISEHKKADEVIHTVLNNLVLSSGSPENWENVPLTSVNSINLVSSSNILKEQKIIALKNYLNDNTSYVDAKGLAGAGPYDFYFQVLDFNGAIISSNGVDFNGGRISEYASTKLSYKRIVSFYGNQVILEAVISRQ